VERRRIETDVASKTVADTQTLSVVILSYNTRETTLNCLRSLFKHSPTIGELEAVVIDNSSSDGSPEAIEEEFPQVKLIRNSRNRGFAAGCNQGIRATDGDVLLLLNSDTLLVDQSLDVMLDFMNRNPDVGIAGGAMIEPNGKPQPSCQPFPSYQNILFSKKSLLTTIGGFKHKFDEYRRVPDAVTDVDAVAGGFLFTRREVLHDVGLLDERFFFYVEDLDFAKRVSQKGWRVVYVPQVKAIHMGGESTSKNPAKCYWWHHKSLLKYFTKHHRKNWPMNAAVGAGLTGHFLLWWLFEHLPSSRS